MADDLADAPDGARLEELVLELLATRRPGATICPSDVARAAGVEDWRSLMDPVRAAAQRLVEAGAVEVTQHGEVVDLPTARGPVRIRRRGPATAP
jgi:hypothetical protein